jgi:anti-sigma B factor antagonist
MIVQTEKKGDIAVLRPVGRVDSANAADFERAVADVFDGGAKRLVLDFSQLEYISSAGLRSTLIAGKKARALEGGRLALCALAPQVAEIFAISGFTAVFTICKDLDEALAQLR